jgi:hypothetical protein
MFGGKKDKFMKFLGVFAKSQKATLLCLSVHVEQLCFHWTDFHEI